MRLTIALHRIDRTPHYLTHSVTGEPYLCTWESIPDGTLSGDIVLQIDEAKLARLLGPRALRSKAKRAILAGGAVVARAVNLKKEDA